MNRTRILSIAFVITAILVAFALAPRTARADLVYEQDVKIQKLDFIKINPDKPGGVDVDKDDFGIDRAAPEKKYSARILIKDNLLKIRHSTGYTFILDTKERTIVRLDRKAGTYSRQTIEEYFSLRDVSEVEIQRKRAANARALMMDIKNTLDTTKDKREKKAKEDMLKPRLEQYQKILDNKYEYIFKYIRGRSEYFEPNVFTRYRTYHMSENETRYISYLGTDEVSETPNRFFPYLRLFAPSAASQLAQREEFPGYMKFYYHYTDYSVAALFHVRGFCRASLPAELFTIPVGYKEVKASFETILEGF